MRSTTCNVSINLSLSKIWRSWYLFKRNKKRSEELYKFNFDLEKNLRKLYLDLNRGSYAHGPYREFFVTENKRRKISVASISDRVVHRLLYQYLVFIYDKTFIFDLWSCRKGKGLYGAIAKTQYLMLRHPNAFIWRSDVKKFFDSVSHERLMDILKIKINDQKALSLLKKIIESYSTNLEPGKRSGIPIGNLTSQIFANIYLNELDRHVKHTLKPIFYLRYGDDFLIAENDDNILNEKREKIVSFLNNILLLSINERSDIIVKSGSGVKFLGSFIYPYGRKLSKRNVSRAFRGLTLKNISSYYGMMKKQAGIKKFKQFNWHLFNKLYKDT